MTGAYAGFQAPHCFRTALSPTLLAMPRDAITLLHLSDPQFGKNHCFGRLDERSRPGCDLAYDTLLARLDEDLAGLKRDFHLQPDIVAVTGDLAEWAREEEFAQAGRFLVGLADLLRIQPAERHRIAIIPGNHDIDRLGAEQDFVGWKRRKKQGDPFGFTRWEYFARMFEDFYKDVPREFRGGDDYLIAGNRPAFVSDRPYSAFAIPEFKVVIAGLNSTIGECHLDDSAARKEFGEPAIYGHHGYCGEAQLQHFAGVLEPFQAAAWLRIGLIHHNLNPAFKVDEERLDHDDLQRLNRILAPHLNLLLHGHTHAAKSSHLDDGLPVFATGSAALGPNERPPEVPNQYQILVIEPSGITIYSRAWSVAEQRFVPDSRIGGNKQAGRESRPLSLAQVAATFPDAPRTASTPRFKVDSIIKLFRRSHSAPGSEEDPESSHTITRPALLDEVTAVCRLRYEHADISERLDTPIPYLRIVTHRPFPRTFPVGVASGGLTPEYIRAFADVHQVFANNDPSVESLLVYPGEFEDHQLLKLLPTPAIRALTFHDFQRICDLDDYVGTQTAVLNASPVYPSNLYVDQNLSVFAQQHHRAHDHEIPPGGITLHPDAALATVIAAVGDPGHAAFVLVHGDFGAGKTFLLRQLARHFATAERSPIPVFIELRSLEKSHSLDEHLAAHFAKAGVGDINLHAIRYMLREGHILLLFDGYDELAINVTFETAAEHLASLAKAAEGQAKVFLTVRTQHFLHDQQMVGKLVTLPGFQRMRLEPFTDAQILRFLTNKLGNPGAAQARFALLDQIKDLLGLSHNPRMLSFISELDEDRLQAARRRDHGARITASALYQIILDQWLANEIKRRLDNRQKDAARLSQLWLAVEKLALIAWPKVHRVLDVKECIDVAAAVITELSETKLDPREEAHAFTSGSLLTREGEGRFAFAHESILEWLVARHAAGAIQAGHPSDILNQQAMTHLMADFLIDLADPDAALAWTNTVLGADDGAMGKHGKANALLVVAVLGKQRGYLGDRMRPSQKQVFINQDLRGKNYDGRNFSGADFTGANLSESSLRQADFQRACFKDAILSRADFTGTDLRGADFTGATLKRATLIGADLRGATLAGGDWDLARLAGATLDDPTLAVLERGRPAREFLPPELTAAVTARPSAPCLPEVLAGASGINCIAWSPREELVAVGHANGCITLWDALTGSSLRTLSGHMNAVLTMAFSPDGRQLASGAGDKSVLLWDVSSGELECTLRGHENCVRSVVFSPDGRWLVSGSDDKTVRLWRAGNGALERTLIGHERAVRSVIFSPDGRWLASMADDNAARVWAAGIGTVERVLPRHTESVRSVDFSPDGRRLATGAGDKMVRLWDPEIGAVERTLAGHEDTVWSVVFSSDSRRLASGSGDKTVRMWNANSGVLERIMKGHEGEVLSVVFSLDGLRLASGSKDKTIRVWDAGTGLLQSTMVGHEYEVLSVAFSPDGRRLASGSSDNTVRLWNTKTGGLERTLAWHKGYARSVAFSPDGKRLASGSGDKTVQLWGAVSGTLERTLVGHEREILSVAWRGDGRRVASGSDDNTVRLWDAGSGKLLRVLAGHQGAISSVVFWQGRADGTVLLASGSHDGTLRLWNPETGDCLGILFATGEAWVAYRPDGRYRHHGNLQGFFWHVAGLCRYEPGELDTVHPGLRLADTEPLIVLP
ncbi:hypothetical protein LBMAG56_21660 [Verrucomicrobiota bacterium]|nr:hypothetical protein LBMAG56_21660 [Verrucomicrobiota bacterium]